MRVSVGATTPALRTISVALLLAACGAPSVVHELDPGSTDSGGTSDASTAGDPPITTTASGPGPGEQSSDSTVADACTDDLECAAAAPFCVEGMCVACDDFADPDAACAAASPELPICYGDTCVACAAGQPGACDGVAACDQLTNSCVACTFHEQCPHSACRIATGECFPSAAVHEVTVQSSLQQVIDGLAPEALAVLRIGGTGTHYEHLIIDDGKRVAIVADRPTVEWSFAGAALPTLAVVGEGTEAYIHGIGLVDNAYGVGVHSEGPAAVYLDRVRITANATGAVTLEDDAALHARNTFFSVSRPDTAVIAAHDGEAHLAHSTIAASSGSAVGLTCNSSGTATIDRSILVSLAAAELTRCGTLAITHSAGSQPLPGATNHVVESGPADPASWFADYATGDLHLAPNHPFSRTAPWYAGAPPTDIDGDARPSLDGIADYPGGDVP